MIKDNRIFKFLTQFQRLDEKHVNHGENFWITRKGVRRTPAIPCSFGAHLARAFCQPEGGVWDGRDGEKYFLKKTGLSLEEASWFFAMKGITWFASNKQPIFMREFRSYLYEDGLEILACNPFSFYKWRIPVWKAAEIMVRFGDADLEECRKNGFKKTFKEKIYFSGDKPIHPDERRDQEIKRAALNRLSII